MTSFDVKKNFYKETYVFYCNSICMDGDSYKYHGLGGSESSLIYMAQEIAQCGKNVIVFCKTEKPGFYDGVRYERLEKFTSYIQFNIIDVFISVRSVDVFLNSIKARLKVLWLHDAADQPHLRFLCERKVQDSIDYYITISEWQAQGLIKKFGIPRERIFSSRNGIKKSYYKILRGSRRKRIVYTSTPFRGLKLLLELFPHIRKCVPDVELYVYSSMEVYGVSREEDQDRFGELYKSCNQPGIKLVGTLPQKQLASELMKAKVFVYPNIFPETSCIAALEAQAAGLPAVASKLGALKETVINKKTGYLIDGEVDSETFRKQFVDNVVKLLEDEEHWRILSVASRARVLNDYCWNFIAREWISFFDSTQPTISLCMIAKDEEKWIKNCIESVKPIVNEIIVVDTGSTDDTKKVAESLGARVYDFKWCDDFSQARNFSISKAKSDWILILDADEVIGNRDLEKVRQLINVSDIYAYLFFQRSYLDDTTVVGWKANTGDYPEGEGYSGYFDSPLTRLFRNNNGFRFEGKVHELVEFSILGQKRNIIKTNIPIHHYGKVKSQDHLADKGALYLEIGKIRIEENPTDPRAYYDLGAQYFELNRFSEAKEYYKKAVNLDKNYYRALCDLGMIYAKEGNYEEALPLLEKVRLINPNYISNYVSLGIVYKCLDRIDDAIGVLMEGLKVDPHNVNAYKNLGLIYFSQNSSKEALQCFRKMKKLDPSISVSGEHAAASYKVGLSLFENKEFMKAKKYFEEAIKVLPSYSSAYNNLGIIYVNSGDYSKAEEIFKKVIELTEMDSKSHKECASAYVNLGFLCNNKGEFKEALDYLEKGLELDTTNPEIYNHIGIAKCGLGLLSDGIKFFEMAIRLQPEHNAAKINFKRVNEVLIQERNYQATAKAKEK